MELTYCEEWFFARRRPIKPLSEAAACKRHFQRKHYTAVYGGFQSPSRVVTFRGPWVSTSFLDARGREYLRYDFREFKPGTLFLKAATYREYPEDTDDVRRAMLFNFEEDGRLVIEDADLISGQIVQSESATSLDGHWEQYPAFGDYACLCREERTRPLLQATHG